MLCKLLKQKVIIPWLRFNYSILLIGLINYDQNAYIKKTWTCKPSISLGEVINDTYYIVNIVTLYRLHIVINYVYKVFTSVTEYDDTLESTVKILLYVYVVTIISSLPLLVWNYV